MTAPQGPWDPPAGPDRHLEAGAYVLGVLDAADRARFEEHLADCPRCAEEVASLGELEPLLAEFKADGAAVGASAAGPLPLGPLPFDPLPLDPPPLAALLAEAAATRRRARVRRRWLVAVAAVLVLGGPAVTAAVLASAPVAGAPSAAAVEHRATAATGVAATVAVTPTAWGSAITLRLTGVGGPRSCDLVAVSAQGASQTVTSWTVPPAGYGPDSPAQDQAQDRAQGQSQSGPQLQTSGGTGFQPGEISHFEVRDLASGQLLISVPADGS